MPPSAPLRAILAAAVLAAFSLPAQAQECQLPTEAAHLTLLQSVPVQLKWLDVEDPVVRARIIEGINAMPPASKDQADHVRIYRPESAQGGPMMFMLFYKGCFVVQAMVPPSRYVGWLE